MRIHTAADSAAMYEAARFAGVSLAMTRHGSRTHSHAFNVTLEGSSNRRPNPGSGQGGDPDARAATWEEWGMFLARVFAADPAARTTGGGGYDGADDYHWQTGDRFRTLTPNGQHKRHAWQVGTPGEQRCECGAVRRWNVAGYVR
jgi:hypothetical protein